MLFLTIRDSNVVFRLITVGCLLVFSGWVFFLHRAWTKADRTSGFVAFAFFWGASAAAPLAHNNLVAGGRKHWDYLVTFFQFLILFSFVLVAVWAIRRLMFWHKTKPSSPRLIAWVLVVAVVVGHGAAAARFVFRINADTPLFTRIIDRTEENGKYFVTFQNTTYGDFRLQCTRAQFDQAVVGANTYVVDFQTRYFDWHQGWVVGDDGFVLETNPRNVGWGFVAIGAAAYTDPPKGKNAVLVAVVDSGIDPSVVQCVDGGYNFYDENNKTYDDPLYDYHGTYIAATIQSTAGNAQILPVKFLRGTTGDADDAVRAMQYAIEQGAKIINCSWGFNEPNEALKTLIEQHQDVLFVCAAGNKNDNLDKTSVYPACYGFANVLSVLAVNKNGEIAPESGFGQQSVDLGAPGVDVDVRFPENEETTVSGTSVATAFVTGGAALLWGDHPDLSAADVKRVLTETVVADAKIAGLCGSGGLLDIGTARDVGDNV